MIFNIDSSIFIAFLIINLALGLFASRGVTTMRSFAIGDKSFSTATLVSTIIATWISGDFFIAFISDVYTEGIGFMSIFVFGNLLSFLIMGLLFIPRMGEFLGKLSIA